MAHSKITAEELEDLRLSYDVPTSITLRAPGAEERADEPPEGFVAIYEPTMQQVLKDWNLAHCQIIPNGWGQMVASDLLWVVAEVRENLTSREFESINRPCRSADWYNFLFGQVKNGEWPLTVPTKYTTGRRGSSS
ncbi:hypothetical protein Adt_35116 [Abeliophyllum distichum]|uniref:Uncharacterized protein n=1 Tax=Abeliophyllum distichum TaxID=126358 RepID=A0ABD1QDU2_9LAMI